MSSQRELTLNFVCQRRNPHRCLFPEYSPTVLAAARAREKCANTNKKCYLSLNDPPTTHPTTCGQVGADAPRHLAPAYNEHKTLHVAQCKRRAMPIRRAVYPDRHR